MIRTLFTCLILVSSYHDFHFSKTVVHYNTNTRTLQTASHLFTDDLEDAVKQTYSADLRLGEQDEHPKADSLIMEYVLANFSIKNSEKQLKLEWIGYEFDYDIVYTYVETEPHEADSSYVVRLSYFNEIFNDQENFIKIKLPNSTLTDITTQLNTEANFND